MKNTRKVGRPITVVNTKPVSKFGRMSVKRKTANPKLWVVYSTNSEDPIYIFNADETSDNVRCVYRRKVKAGHIKNVRAVRMSNFIKS